MTERPVFLDWRWWLCMAVATLFSTTTVRGFGLDESGWRFAVYAANGLLAGSCYRQWARWRAEQ